MLVADAELLLRYDASENRIIDRGEVLGLIQLYFFP